MKERLKVLVIEDSNDDAILLIRRLRKSGYEPEWSRVETRGEMETALEERAWDLIISDHSMPGFNAGMALRVLKKRDLDVPLVILSGTIDEKEAVEAMKAGACDFIKKGDSARLMPAIEREVRQLKARRAARRVELELRAAQRMEAIGRLAGGVAHDFNNLLSIILGACSFLLAEVPESDSEKRQDLEDIRDAGERAASLTRQLLAFSRKQIFKTEALDINAVVSNMARMLKRLINESVRMEIKLADGLKPVLGDRGQLEQVLVNLVVNARDAMSRGGSLTLSTQERTLAGSGGRAFEFKPGNYVVLSVADTGMGMNPETLSQIFEPFFTTKSAGRGTGLGLATVFGIVKQSKGYIWAESAPGKGTVFYVALPAAEGKWIASPPSEVDVTTLSGTETVLVAEDDNNVRRLLQRVLEKNGYRVLLAASGSEGLDVARAHHGDIHLVVTDVIMPKMGGGEFGGEIGSICPKARVLYLSGYTEDAIADHGVLKPGIDFLQKPVVAKTLLRKVREILDRP